MAYGGISLKCKIKYEMYSYLIDPEFRIQFITIKQSFYLFAFRRYRCAAHTTHPSLMIKLMGLRGSRILVIPFPESREGDASLKSVAEM